MNENLEIEPKTLGRAMKYTFSFIVTLVILLGSCVLAKAQQQPKRVPRIGYLSTRSNTGKAFVRGLRDLGYVEGKSISIEYRFANGKPERLPALAAELINLNVDLIVAASSRAAIAASELTQTIPIIVTNSAGDYQFARNLSRPRKNITGLTFRSAELSGKRIELMKEIIPRLHRIAILSWSNIGRNHAAEVASVSQELGLEMRFLKVMEPANIESTFEEVRKAHADAVIIISNPLFIENRSRVVESARRSRITASFPNREFVEAGGLMSYGANPAELIRRSARYVDKILKGVKVADLPIEEPMKAELVFNLKTAREINLKIPSAVLIRADEVIQ